MRTTVSLPDDLAAYVDDQRPSDEDSDAEAIRDAIRRAQDLEERVAELETEVDRLETELERVRTEKRLILEEREEHQELVRVVEREQSLEERRAQAGLAQRARWWLFGMDDDE